MASGWFSWSLRCCVCCPYQLLRERVEVVEELAGFGWSGTRQPRFRRGPLQIHPTTSGREREVAKSSKAMHGPCLNQVSDIVCMRLNRAELSKTGSWT